MATCSQVYIAARSCIYFSTLLFKITKQYEWNLVTMVTDKLACVFEFIKYTSIVFPVTKFACQTKVAI